MRRVPRAVPVRRTHRVVVLRYSTDPHVAAAREGREATSVHAWPGGVLDMYYGQTTGEAGPSPVQRAGHPLTSGPKPGDGRTRRFAPILEFSGACSGAAAASALNSGARARPAPTDAGQIEGQG